MWRTSLLKKCNAAPRSLPRRWLKPPLPARAENFDFNCRTGPGRGFATDRACSFFCARAPLLGLANPAAVSFYCPPTTEPRRRNCGGKMPPSLTGNRRQCIGKSAWSMTPFKPTDATARRRRARRWRLRVSLEESACPLPCRKRTPSSAREHFGRVAEFGKRPRPVRLHRDRED